MPARKGQGQVARISRWCFRKAKKKEPEKKQEPGEAKTPPLAAPASTVTEPKKKEPEKKEQPTGETLVYGSKMGPAKLIVRIEGGLYAIDVPVPDPMKIQQLQIWSMQQTQSIAQQQNPVQRAQQMARYQSQYAQKQLETTWLQTVEFRPPKA